MELLFASFLAVIVLLILVVKTLRRILYAVEEQTCLQTQQAIRQTQLLAKIAGE